MWRTNLFQFLPVLVLITCVIHRSKLYFEVGGYIVYSTNHLGKSLTGRRCRAYRTISYEICGKITPFILRRRGRKLKRSCSLCLRGHNLHSRVRSFCKLYPYLFLSPIEIFIFLKKLKRVICTLLLCSKSGSPCSSKLKEKEHLFRYRT